MVHVDIVGPLTVSQGQRYLLTCVDRFTRWPEVIPIHDICADTVAKVFFNGWVARFGVPSAVISGRQFESELWSDLCKLLGIKKCRTTAYHPQSNGMVERLHHQLKASLRPHDTYSDWMAVLPAVLLGIRSAIKDDLNCTSSELVYGTTLRLPGKYFAIDIKSKEQNISIDRLKPAYVELPTGASDLPIPSSPTTTTRSGRII